MSVIQTTNDYKFGKVVVFVFYIYIFSAQEAYKQLVICIPPTVIYWPLRHSQPQLLSVASFFIENIYKVFHFQVQ